MAIFRRGDVERVPFPYTDRSTRQRRPALVVSSARLEDQHDLLWVLMITSAENRGWPGDVLIDDLDSTGRPVSSVIRTAKIATIEATHAERLGKLPAPFQRKVAKLLAGEFGTA